MGDGEKEVTLQSAVESAADRLRSHSDTPELDAQVLLASVLKQSRSWLAAHPEARLDREPVAAFDAQTQRLERGEPLPYVLGEWEFFGLTFRVTPDVLIPRPETELLVEHAIAWLRKLNVAGRTLHVADVGTGSGCIAISLAVNVPEIQVTATDISSAALTVARGNAERLHVSERVTFLQSDLIPDDDRGPWTVDDESRSMVHRPPSSTVRRPSSFDLIVANLPYIPTDTLHGLPIFRREPTLALDGGTGDGLDIIRRLLAKSQTRLAPGGMILLEIEASQGQVASALAREVFPKAAVKIHQDLVGHDRLIEIQS
jgi:release factor glutamine methyltransferase